jgi:sugar lactone lactonase YvrE
MQWRSLIPPGKDSPVSRRTLAIVALTALAVTVGAAPASAHPAASSALTTIQLPDGFQPEGIAIGSAPYAYFGSRVDGDIYRVDLRTGRGRVISQGPGTPSLGMKIDRRGRLFVSGGTGGDARVLDARTGRVLQEYALHAAPSFVNDVTLTGGAAWFTDSTNPVLYKLPPGRHGKLPSAAVPVPLTGDIAYTNTGPNANGISPTPDRRALIIVQSNTGKLFRTTYDGRTRQIDLGAESVPNGDGLWLRGRTLYVVQNQLNAIAKIKLNWSGSRGQVLSRTTDPRFDVPTTIAEFGKRFYLPNARFTTPATPTTPYTAVAVRIP